MTAPSDTDDLRARLHQLADTADAPRADLADTVLHRRRVVRGRRLGAAGAALAVVLVVAVVPFLVGSAERGGEAATTTRGSLAGDTGFVDGMLRVPWTYQQWVTSSGGTTLDPQLQPDVGWTSQTTDLAAAYAPDQRTVVFAGDVPGARWAFVVLAGELGDTGAWFSGPPGAAPEEMTISGTPQTVGPDEPVAHLDLANPERPLVVLTRPGDDVALSERAVLEADATVTRTYAPLPDDDADGVLVTALTSSTQFGDPASVRIDRDGETAWRSSPSEAGVPAGIDRDDPRGWGVGIEGRYPATVDPGYDYLDAALATALSPFGLSLADLPARNASELVQLFQGSARGTDTISEPLVTVYGVELPSGARVLVGGWTAAVGDTTPEGLQPDQGVSFLGVRPADADVATDVVALEMPVSDRGGTTDTLVVVGPVTASLARVFDTDGQVLTEVALQSGTTSMPTPRGASSVQVLRADGSTAGTSPVLTDDSATWGDAGQSPWTSFGIPIPAPR